MLPGSIWLETIANEGPARIQHQTACKNPLTGCPAKFVSLCMCVCVCVCLRLDRAHTSSATHTQLYRGFLRGKRNVAGKNKDSKECVGNKEKLSQKELHLLAVPSGEEHPTRMITSGQDLVQPQIMGDSAPVPKHKSFAIQLNRVRTPR